MQKNKRIENPELLNQFRSAGICEICNGAFENLDPHHIITRGASGPDHPYNLLKLCRKCHQDCHKPFSQYDRLYLFSIVSDRENTHIGKYTIYAIMRGEEEKNCYGCKGYSNPLNYAGCIDCSNYSNWTK
jgi:hypothetical protein